MFFEMLLKLCSTKLTEKPTGNWKSTLLNCKCLIKLVVEVDKNCKMTLKDIKLYFILKM